MTAGVRPAGPAGPAGRAGASGPAFPGGPAEGGFPLAALAGQRAMVRALILLAVDPDIGGLLLVGEKGTAKSTAARGLAGIMAPITARDCPYHCLEGRREFWCPECLAADGPFAESAPPLRTIPLGVTEERLIGGLDWEATLRRARPVVRPGLLGEANNGLAYIDEVNLLDPSLAHLMLDAAAGGRVSVERDGLSLSHPAKVALLGSMNPEEGPLGPQLADRFALTVVMAAEPDPAVRAEIVRRRLEFERDPAAFRERFRPATAALRAAVVRARAIAPGLRPSGRALELAAELARGARAAGHRAELALIRAAVAQTAWEMAGAPDASGPAAGGATGPAPEMVFSPASGADFSPASGRPDDPPNDPPSDPFPGPPPGQPAGRLAEVGPEAVWRTVQLVLPQRRRTPRAAPAGLAPAVIRRERAPERAGAEPAVSADPPPPAADGGPAEEPDRTVLTVFEAAEAFEAVAPKAPKEAGAKDKSGRRGARETLKARGRAYRTTARRLGRPLSLSATLRAAAPLQAARRAALASALVPIRPGGPAGDPAGGFGDPPGRRLIVSPADFREKVYRLKTGRLVIFVVDASGSIGALYRMEEAKAAALALLRDAYRQRDRVAVISFHGRTADLLLPPTNSPDLAGRLLAALPSGGKTPMAAALALTARLISIERARDPKLAPHVVLMTDGRPNVPLDPAGQPWPEVLGMASRLAADPAIRFLLIDTDRGAYNDYKLTRQLALRLGCRRITIEDLRGGALDRWLEG